MEDNIVVEYLLYQGPIPIHYYSKEQWTLAIRTLRYYKKECGAIHNYYLVKKTTTISYRRLQY